MECAVRTLAGRDAERTDGDIDTVPPLCVGGIFTTGDDVARGGLKLRCGEMMACRRATLEWRRGSGPSTGGSAGVTVHAVPAPLVDRGFGAPRPWRVGDEVQVPMAAPHTTVGPYETAPSTALRGAHVGHHLPLARRRGWGRCSRAMRRLSHHKRDTDRDADRGKPYSAADWCTGCRDHHLSRQLQPGQTAVRLYKAARGWATAT